MNTAFLMLFPVILGLIELPCNFVTNPDYSTIADPHSRWRAYGITSYTVVQRLNCYCINGGVQMRVTVRENAIVNVQRADLTMLPREQWPAYKTVEELFTIIRRAKSGTLLSAEYDRRYGYPTNFFIDPIREAADDEFGYQTEGFRRLER